MQKTEFWNKVKKTETCWLWLGAKDPNGYGNVRLPGGKYGKAHRFAYQIAYGNIPDGLLILHICDNPCCVRPSHLVPGTQRENMLDWTTKHRNPAVKLTETQVIEIKNAIKHWYKGLGIRLAQQYNVAPCTINDIKMGRTWSHI